MCEMEFVDLLKALQKANGVYRANENMETFKPFTQTAMDLNAAMRGILDSGGTLEIIMQDTGKTYKMSREDIVIPTTTGSIKVYEHGRPDKRYYGSGYRNEIFLPEASSIAIL